MWTVTLPIDRDVKQVVVIDGVNRNDSIVLEPTLRAVADQGQLPDIEAPRLDCGYDSALTLTRCAAIAAQTRVSEALPPPRGNGRSGQTRPSREDATVATGASVP